MPLREVLAVFGVRVDDKQLSDSTKRMAEWASKARAAGNAAAAAAVAIGGAFVKSQIDVAEGARLNAERLGLTTDAMQELGFVATLAGREVDDVVDAMATLQERARDAVIDPKSDPAEQLRLLGVSAKDASGQLKSAEQLFDEVADGLLGMSTQSDRVGAAMTLFGDVGRELLPVLQKGSAGLEEFRKIARDTGLIMDEDLIKRSEEASMQLKLFKASVQGASNELFSAMLPAFTAIVQKGRELARWFRDLARNTTMFESMAAAAKIAAVALAVLNAKLILIGAIIAAVFVLWDDLYALWTGNDSAIGAFFDSIIGAQGAMKAGVEDIKAIWDSLMKNFEAGYRIIGELASAFGANFSAGKQIISSSLGLGGGGSTNNTNVVVNTQASDAASVARETARAVEQVNDRHARRTARAVTGR